MDFIDIQAQPKTKFRFIYIPIILIISIFAFQLFMLTSLGDKGEKLTNLINKQTELKSDNEILKAKILELQTNKAVVEPLSTQVKVEKKDIYVINLSTESDLALANR